MPGATLLGFGFVLRDGSERGGTWTFEDALRRSDNDVTSLFANWDNDNSGALGDVFTLLLLYGRLTESEAYKEGTINAAIYDSGRGYYIETQEGRERLKPFIRQLMTNECGRAFREAGLKSPGLALKNGELIFAAREVLNDSSNNEALGLTEEARAIKNSSSAPATTLLPQESVSGRIGVIFVSRRAFWEPSNMTLTDFAAHETIHGLGVPTSMSWYQFRVPIIGVMSRGHDLSAFPGYDKIVSACATGRR